jgi:hypothetical protein
VPFSREEAGSRGSWRRGRTCTCTLLGLIAVGPKPGSNPDSLLSYLEGTSTTRSKILFHVGDTWCYG